jgi:iron-sulfur cluster assembly accessory protein
MNSIITVTPAALAEIERLYKAAEEDLFGLRIAVIGGGCAGFQYALGFDDADDEDIVVDLQSVRLVVDQVSLPFLQGAVVNWSGGLTGKGFTVDNPNADSSCGCGKSFSAEPEAPSVSKGCDGCALA